MGFSDGGQRRVRRGELACLQAGVFKGQLKWFCLSLYFVLMQMAMSNLVQAQESFFQLSGVMHLHSQFSSGSETLEDIAQRATDRGLDVVILSLIHI